MWSATSPSTAVGSRRPGLWIPTPLKVPPSMLMLGLKKRLGTGLEKIPPKTSLLTSKSSPKGECYADGLMLQALAERLGTGLVVWSWNATQHTWVRSVLAPFEIDGLAGKAKKSPDPVVVVLKDAHYRALLSSDPCPTAWLQVTRPRPRMLLQGGGKLSLPPSTPSLPSEVKRRVQAQTPSDDKAGGTPVRMPSLLSLPSCTPLRTPAVGSSLERVGSLPSLGRTALGPLTLPRATPGNTEAAEKEGPTRAEDKLRHNAEALAALRAAGTAKRFRLRGKQPGFRTLGSFGSGSVGHLQRFGSEDSSAEVDGSGPDLGGPALVVPLKSKKHHFRTRHAETPMQLILAAKPTVAMTSATLPQEQRAWTCPLCKDGLPVLSSQDMKRTKKAHVQARHPHLTVKRLFHLSQVGKPKAKKGVSRKQLASHQATKPKVCHASVGYCRARGAHRQGIAWKPALLQNVFLALG